VREDARHDFERVAAKLGVVFPARRVSPHLRAALSLGVVKRVREGVRDESRRAVAFEQRQDHARGFDGSLVNAVEIVQRLPGVVARN
jgi:hypothetical protein